MARALVILFACALPAFPQANAARRSTPIGSPIPAVPQPQTAGCPDAKVPQTQPPPPAITDYVELRRTSCYGPCPVYTVRIDADGQVAWKGDRGVRAHGEVSSNVPPEAARALIDKFTAASFLALCEKYDRPITDFPSTITLLHVGDIDKTVTDRANAAPEWLGNLEMEVDLLADTHRWIHGDPRLEKLPEIFLDSRGPKPGLTPLMRSAWKGDLGEVKIQLSAGADPNAQDSSGATALIYATQIAKPEVLKTLLQSGASPNIPTFAGQSALMAASSWYTQPEEKIEILLAVGADVNTRDQSGETALMMAVRSHFEQPAVVALLIKNGARKDAKDAAGLTALNRLEQDPRREKLPAQFQTLRKLLQ